MSLLVLQRDLGAWLRTGEEDAAQRVGERYAPGLRVYQNNYRAQLVACLEASFPKTLAWLGEDAFHDALVRHIDRVPPSSWTLDAYGRDFADTLSTIYPDDREVAELAWLEWALEEAFVAPDHAEVSAAAVGGIDWDRAVLTLSPSIDMSELTTNAPAIWSALANEETPPIAETLAEPGALLVWRNSGVSCFRVIDTVERDAILLARAGANFPTICERIVDRAGEAAGVQRAGELLGQWLREGLLAAVAD